MRQADARRALQFRADEKGANDESAAHASSAAKADREDVLGYNEVVGVGGMRLDKMLGMFPKYVDPFYADKSKDNGRSVVQFLDSFESTMELLFIDPNTHHRLRMIMLSCKEGALRWVRNKVKELELSARREGRDLKRQPLSWKDEMEEDFIRAHVGVDEPPIWLAQLRTLKLGGKKTSTPSELDSEFDRIARYVMPTATSEEMNTSIALYEAYGQCIENGDPQLYLRVLEVHCPTTLREWKTALARQWVVNERLKLRRATPSTASYVSRGGGGGGYRGGRGGYSTQSKDAPKQSVSAAATNTAAPSEGVPGESFTEEGKDDTPQLSAANTRGGRGGRGGRGRGRGGGFKHMTAEQRKWFVDGLCLQCGADGHYSRECPKAEGEH